MRRQSPHHHRNPTLPEARKGASCASSRRSRLAIQYHVRFQHFGAVMICARLMVVVTLVCMMPTAMATRHAPKQVTFPDEGTPYVRARASLLSQGLIVAPDKPEHPDRAFRECDRSWDGNGRRCRVLFLETNEHGWRYYDFVIVDLKTKTVLIAGPTSTADGLPPIPPPLAADVPHIKGGYLKARQRLQSLGFRPVELHASYNRFDTDRPGGRNIALPEADCSVTGYWMCYMWWTAKNGRILKVTTEIDEVYYVEWSSQQALEQSR